MCDACDALWWRSIKLTNTYSSLNYSFLLRELWAKDYVRWSAQRGLDEQGWFQPCPQCRRSPSALCTQPLSLCTYRLELLQSLTQLKGSQNSSWPTCIITTGTASVTDTVERFPELLLTYMYHYNWNCFSHWHSWKVPRTPPGLHASLQQTIHHQTFVSRITHDQLLVHCCFPNTKSRNLFWNSIKPTVSKTFYDSHNSYTRHYECNTDLYEDLTWPQHVWELRVPCWNLHPRTVLAAYTGIAILMTWALVSAETNNDVRQTVLTKTTSE